MMAPDEKSVRRVDNFTCDKHYLIGPNGTGKGRAALLQGHVGGVA